MSLPNNPSQADMVKSVKDIEGKIPNFVSDSNYVHTDNNYTTVEKNKLNGIAAGAEVNVNADWNATSGDARILNKPSNVSAFNNDASYAKITIVRW